MTVKQESPHATEFEEQTAAARASLERHIAEARAERARLRAEGIDSQESLWTAVRETFDPEALWETYREWLTERGKDLPDTEATPSDAR